MRIDPLTEDETFDMDFFASEEYMVLRKSVEQYLIQEGFEEIKEKMLIRLGDRLWSVQNT